MTQAEPLVQPIFSKFFSSLMIAAPVIGLAMWLRAQPSRWPGPDRLISGEARPVPLGGALRGWRLTAPDRRFGGLSALALDEGKLLALTDSGVAVRFPRPRGKESRIIIALRDLPAGPGSARRKSARDSEALLRDANGRGWWAAFESRHSLWLFDGDFGRALAARRLKVDWSANRGGEALLAGADGSVMVLPEGGGAALGGRFATPAWTSDATRLADGRSVVLVRQPTWRGFATRVEIGAGAGRPARRYALALGALDNMEGIAAETRADGGTRLWIVSDDNFRPWMRTLLVAFDLPSGA